MNEAQLSRALQSVGMTFFIRHISILADMQVCANDVAVKLRMIVPYTDKSLASRISTARRIIEAGKVEDAMEKIASAKVDDEIAALARRWRLRASRPWRTD